MKMINEHREEKIVEAYMQGFEDELQNNPMREFNYTALERAYELGRTDALIGDEVRSVDYRSKEELLNRVYNIKKEPKFKIGDKAIKVKGYKFPCTIVSVFKTVGGNIRVVGEMDEYGLLHIFNEDQLEHAE